MPVACAIYAAWLVDKPHVGLYMLKYYVAGVVPRNIYSTHCHNGNVQHYNRHHSAKGFYMMGLY